MYSLDFLFLCNQSYWTNVQHRRDTDTTAANPLLREQFRNVIRVNHYSIRTEKTYWCWMRYFPRYHRMRHALERGPAEVSEFLTWLAVRRHVAAATQNRTLNARVFLYGKVLDRPLGDIGDTVRTKRYARIPKVLTRSEATPLIALLPEPHKLLAPLMHGSGPLRRGSDTRTVKTALRHADVRTTQIYTHVLGNTFALVQSPLG